MTDEHGAYYRLEDLLARPELLEPPPVVLPRLAWSGRVTLLASPEKTGKSTLVGQAVAAKAQGKEFLGEPTERGSTLWLALDEPLNDVVRRLARYGARDHVAISQEVHDPIALEGIMRDVGATVLVIDTLSEFARGVVDDYNSAAQWTPQLHALRRVLQNTGAGGILLHHSTKATSTTNTRYRDSSAIGAGVDAILEMSTPPADPVVRAVRARGRMVMADFQLRFVEPWYQLEGAEMPLELRVYRVVESRPGASQNQIREAVYGGKKAVDQTIEDLCRRGAVEDRGNGRGHAYHVTLVEPVGRGRGEGGLGWPKSNGANAGEVGARSPGEVTSPHLVHGGGEVGTDLRPTEPPANAGDAWEPTA